MDGITKYVFRQVGTVMFFITLCLTLAIWLTQSLRFVDLIVNRGLPVIEFLYLSMLLLPRFLVVVVPVALFASVLFTYNRLTMDSELIVCRAVGFSQAALSRPALLLAGEGATVDEPAAEEIDQQDIAAFGNSQYTYCDAKLISELWSIGILDAKATIGYKLRNNYGDLIPPILAEARQSHSCDWVDTGLAYADAEKLAGIWKVPVDQAKTKAAAYYTAGESQIVLGALDRG